VEFFRPEAYPAGGLPARSARQRVELDCPGVRWRITEVDAFRLNNLDTPEPPFQAPDAQWAAPIASPEAKMVRRLCDLAGATATPAEPARGHLRHRRKSGR
jgi:hypothetical protein